MMPKHYDWLLKLVTNMAELIHIFHNKEEEEAAFSSEILLIVFLLGKF